MAVEIQRIDILNRDGIVEDLFSIVQRTSKNKTYCSFALEGTWGVGKTFVIEQLEKKLDIEINEDTLDSRYYVFHYNCWKYDYYDEPAIAIVSALKDKVDKEFDVELKGKLKDSWEVAKGIVNDMAKEFVENKIGIDLVQVYGDVKNRGIKRREKENEFDKLFAFNKTLEIIRKRIEELANYKTVVVIVDELDRCMPSYAIKILERLHHMFENIDNAIVLIAVDSAQLEQSIKEIYGNTVNTERYLKKFISFKYKIDEGRAQAELLDKFCGYFSLFERYEDISKTLVDFFELCKLDVRTIEKIIEKCKLVHEMICNEKVSNSVLLFEIMSTTMEYILLNPKHDNRNCAFYGKNLHWIPDVNLSTYVELENALDKKLLQFIKDMVKNAIGATIYMGENKRSINMTPEGVCIGYMDILFSTNKKLRFEKDTQESANELRVCESYTKLCKNIY